MEQGRDFAAGRRDGIQKIQALIPTDIEKYATMVVTDNATFLSKQDALHPLVHMARALTKANLDCFRAAADQLESGVTVYQLTGAVSLPASRCIIDGDYQAGVMSAVEDMIALLGTIDGAAIYKPFQVTGKALGQLADDNDIRLSTMCTYNHEMLVDTIFMRMYENIIRNMTKLKHVVYEESDEPPKRRNLFSGFEAAVRAQQAPLDRFSSRRNKMPKLWPPLKTQATIMLEFSAATDKPADVVVPVPLNDSRSYAEGFMRGMRVIYDELQLVHFDALERGEGYVSYIGHDTAMGKLVGQVALNQFAILRENMRDVMHERQILGAGQNYDDGLKGAQTHVTQMVAQLRQLLMADPRTATDLSQTNAFDSIQPFWLQEISRVIDAERAPRKTSVAAEPRKPSVS